MANAESEGSGPTAHVAIDAVGLFLEAAIASFITMKGMEGPVFVETVINAAAEEIVALTERSWAEAGIVAEIKVPEADAPDVVGLKSDGVKSHAPAAIGDVIASEGIESDPGAWVKGEIGAEISEGA